MKIISACRCDNHSKRCTFDFALLENTSKISWCQNSTRIQTVIRLVGNTRNPENHQINQQRKKVQSGLEHTSRKGNVIKAKHFGEQLECCQNKCVQKFNVTRQKCIFDSYYSLDSLPKKRLFLRSMVKIRAKKENLNPITSKNRKIYDYFLTHISGVQEKRYPNGNSVTFLTLNLIWVFIQKNRTLVAHATS